ncbi:LOW QUALITY PROTEIN: hypothetical protein HID58_007116 [Brassica napus]|uniref:Uncharacterized protein n=1 Tax=Brassica napus TaxID=3708 RepID=A0ABQ8EGA3_BRANA|nr:LOW QUALITY PROTEIN: hypothetical protein HID58_007116 [Brassica napus]
MYSRLGRKIQSLITSEAYNRRMQKDCKNLLCLSIWVQFPSYSYRSIGTIFFDKYFFITRVCILATQTKLVTESENCWRALAWNPALNICKPLVHRKCWAKRKPLECHLLVSESNPSFRYNNNLLFWSPVRFIIRKCSSIKCFEVRKRLYGHQHDAQRSDPIFNIAQLKEASEENKTDSGLSQMAKILVHEVQHSKHVHNVAPFRDRSSVDVKSIANGALKISERQPLECRLVSAAFNPSARYTKLVTESENCWRALAWNTTPNICNPLAFVVILLCIDRINYPLILTPLCKEAEDASSDCYVHRKGSSKVSGINLWNFIFRKPERKTKQSLFACLRFIANDFGKGLRSGVYSLCYHETEQVQDMNLQPKVVRMAEMEELRVEVKGESLYDITLEGYITRLETVRHVELEVWHHFRRLYYSAGDVRRVKLEVRTWQKKDPVVEAVMKYVILLALSGDSLASIQETKVLGLRSDIYLQCNQSLNQEPYEFSGTMKQNKFSIRISNKTSLDGRIFDELRVELITKKIIIKERQSVHFTVVVVIPFGISPEFEDKFTACGVHRKWSSNMAKIQPRYRN